LVYISIPDIYRISGENLQLPIAVAIFSYQLHRKILKFLTDLVTKNPHFRLLEKFDDYEQRTYPKQLDPILERALSCMEEFAQSSENILHLGVFGALSRFLGQGISPIAPREQHYRWKFESDLDLIIILRANTDMKDIKSQIERALRCELKDIELEIEWSKERNNFYYFRKSNHIDVQIHHRGDCYYSEQTPLLGYAVFYGGYHVLYSKGQTPVSDLLEIPRKPITIQTRANIYLNDELGLKTFIRQCSTRDNMIDPRRVVAINLRNFVWVLTGMYPVSLSQAAAFIKENSFLNKYINQRVFDAAISAFDEEKLDEKSSKKRNYLHAALLFLKELETSVIEIQKDSF
jgi:hypothetical protein